MMEIALRAHNKIGSQHHHNCSCHFQTRANLVNFVLQLQEHRRRFIDFNNEAALKLCQRISSPQTHRAESESSKIDVIILVGVCFNVLTRSPTKWTVGCFFMLKLGEKEVEFSREVKRQVVTWCELFLQ